VNLCLIEQLNKFTREVKAFQQRVPSKISYPSSAPLVRRAAGVANFFKRRPSSRRDPKNNGHSGGQKRAAF
jgi:hypothetical protein